MFNFNGKSDMPDKKKMFFEGNAAVVYGDFPDNDKWNLGITNQELFKNEDGKRDPYKDGLSYWWKEEN